MVYPIDSDRLPIHSESGGRSVCNEGLRSCGTEYSSFVGRANSNKANDAPRYSTM